MIYQDVKRYLKRYYQTPKKDYQWSGQDNFKLLNYIQDRYSDEEINKNSSEVKQAFRDFFEPVGNLIIKFSLEKGVAYKVIPYYVQPQNSKHLKDIINIIQKNRRSIVYPYLDRDDQMALLGKIRRKINAIIAETDEAVNKKELIRYAIKQALDLDDRDIVINLKRKYVIKLFKKNLSHTANTIEKDEEYFDDQDFELQYDELIKDIDINDFLISTMQVLFSKELSFDTLTNSYYEKNALILIKNKITEELKTYMSENSTYVSGFAGYILKKNFEKIHEIIALELFEQLSKKNKNAIQFLQYYSGKTIILDKKQYIMPNITTPDGKQWNITSIITTSSSWQNLKDKLKKIQTELKNINKVFNESSKRYKSLSDKLKNNEHDRDELIKKAKKIEDELIEAKIKFKKGFLEHNNTLEVEYSRQHKQKLDTLNKIKKQIDELEHPDEAFQQDVMIAKRQYKELLRRKEKLESIEKGLKENLAINSSYHNSILASMVKALMKRKRQVK